MSSDKMDQYFKENLQAHETPLDTNALWESIAPEVVEEKKSRKWFVWWFWGAGCLLIGAGLWGVTTATDKGAESVTTTVVVSEDELAVAEICNEYEYTQNSDNEIVNKPLEGQVSTTDGSSLEKNNAAALTIDNSNNAPLDFTQPKNSHQETLAKKAQNQAVKISEVDAKSSSENENAAIVDGNNLKITPLDFTQLEKTQEEELVEKKAPKEVLNNNAIIENKTVENTEKETIKTIEELDKKSEFLLNAKNGGDRLLTENKEIQSIIVPYLPIPNALLFISKTVLEIPFLPIEKDNVATFVEKEKGAEKPKTKKKHNPFSIALYATPSISMRQFTAKGNDTLAIAERNKAFMKRRQSSEQSLELFNVGLTFNWHHSSGFYLGSGLQYGQINEKFTYRKQTKWIEHSAVAVDSIYTRTITKEIYNRFKMIDIPLFAGYEFGKNKWRYSIQAGALLNLSLLSEGQIFGLEEGTFKKYDDINNVIYKKSIGMSFTGSVGINRMLNDNWSIGAQVGVRYFPKSFTLDNYVLQQKYFNLGLKIKCAYRFGN